jgi:hypothetical protein
VAHSWIGFPSGEVAPQSLRESFPVVVCPLVVDSLSEMVFTGPYAPPIRNRSDAPLPPPLAFLSLCRVRARGTFDLFGIVKQIVDAKAQFRSLAEP